jgi:leader peptidase (prepilin peptidase) / N-methyltransferase
MTHVGKAKTKYAESKWMRGLSSGNVVHELSTRTALMSAVLALVAVAAIYLSFASAPGIIGIMAAGFALVMLAIAVIDWRSFIIPDWLNAAGVGFAMMHAAAQEPEAMARAVAIAALRGVVLALIFFAVRYGYARFRGRQGLGLGDVKLAFVAGAWLDWVMIPIAIQLAAFATLSAYIVRQLVSGRAISTTNRMPFGLFFAPAIWICWVLEVRWLEAF